MTPPGTPLWAATIVELSPGGVEEQEVKARSAAGRRARTGSLIVIGFILVISDQWFVVMVCGADRNLPGRWRDGWLRGDQRRGPSCGSNRRNRRSPPARAPRDRRAP